MLIGTRSTVFHLTKRSCSASSALGNAANNAISTPPSNNSNNGSRISSSNFQFSTLSHTASTFPLRQSIQTQTNTSSLLSMQRRSMFIQTANTPNPESIKFLPGRPVLEDDSEDAETDATTNGFYVTNSDKPEIARSPLCQKLFQIDGIKAIYLGADFITITKYAQAHWAHVRTPVFSAIMDFYASKEPALLDTPVVTDTTILEDDTEVVAMIKELLETRIRPAVQEDGGDIRYEGFDTVTGIVQVRLAGSCVGCPSSSVTLKNGVENMLLHYVPEVTAVEAVEEEEDDAYVGEGGEFSDGDEVKIEHIKMKSYEDRLKDAGIPFSD